MSNVAQTTSLSLNSQLLPDDKGQVPDWVHLLPTSEGMVQTNDARGPYHVSDAEKIIAASFAEADRLPIDENHATDLAAPKGLPAPAHGWIISMQARADGIWGKVEWSDQGRALLAARAYRNLSPVIAVPLNGSKAVLSILRASLVNRPNFRGLASLNQETDDMSFQKTMAGVLGLSADASEADISTALTALKDNGATATTELQSQLGEIGTALGVADGGDVLAAAKVAKAGLGGETALQASVTELQAANTTLQTSLNALTTDRALDKATAFVTGEMEKGRMIPGPLKDHYISMHQQDPARVEKEINALPKMSGAIIPDVPPEHGGAISLNATELASKATVYQAEQAAAGNEISMSAAVHAVQEDRK
ncbi:phage protease [Parasedimentitalea psychrophila]|uniref:Phage protease n=1 Tax=Parasedimentitalea psychrophila TaxID=2997337 RepID=A0A9Y2KXP5_9RHOB|nr:phage protease [Parasedimentitalea psychrophila]WIY25055.1 phage protease [Parasedimentitalea psychrophila]